MQKVIYWDREKEYDKTPSSSIHSDKQRQEFSKIHSIDCMVNTAREEANTSWLYYPGGIQLQGWRIIETFIH
jgi:hypothetical protein